MKKTTLHIGVLCGAILIFVSTSSAQNRQASHPVDPTNSNTPASPSNTKTDVSPTGEMELLRHRVEEVEKQNRELMQVVNDLKGMR